MDLPDAVDAIRPSVVQIGIRLPNTELPRMVGTGFIVDDRGTIVTAWHVISGLFELARASGVTEKPTFIAGLAHPQLFEAGGHLLGMQGFTFVDLDLLIAVPDHDLGIARMTENVATGESDLAHGPLIDEVRVPPLAGIASLNTKRPREGAAVGVSGYPFAVNSLITNSG